VTADIGGDRYVPTNDSRGRSGSLQAAGDDPERPADRGRAAPRRAATWGSLPDAQSSCSAQPIPTPSVGDVAS
jgi:hypothetical protein